MYTNDDEYYFDEDIAIINSKQSFENFKNQNPTYLGALNNHISHLYTVYSYLHKKNFYKIENDPELFETVRCLGFGMLMRHALEVISIDVCTKNSIDIGGKSVYERLSMLRGQILPDYDQHMESVLTNVLNATNTVAHPHIVSPGTSFAALENLYCTSFRAIIEKQILLTDEKRIKKYLQQVQKELDAFNIRETYPHILTQGCLIRQLTECITNLWCYNLSILPTDASVEGNYIDLRTAQYNLRCIAYNNTNTAFGKSSLNLNVVDTLHDLKNTSNTFMHVNYENLNISNIKKAGQALWSVYPDVFKKCSPQIKLGKADQDSPPVVATVLCGFLGWFGVHHFYAGNIFKGILYLLTFGCFFVGPLYNLNQLRRGTFVSKKRGALVKTRWSTILAYIFMALHIYLLYRILFKQG